MCSTAYVHQIDVPAHVQAARYLLNYGERAEAKAAELEDCQQYSRRVLDAIRTIRSIGDQLATLDHQSPRQSGHHERGAGYRETRDTMSGGSFRQELWPQPGHPDYGKPDCGIMLYTARCGACSTAMVTPNTDTSEEAIRSFTSTDGRWQIEDNVILCPEHATR